MNKEVEAFTKTFLEHIQGKHVRLISHFDTDGITSAAVITKMLKRLDKTFSVRIVKGLDETIITEELKRQPEAVLIFTDLASGSLAYFKNATEPVFIIDHHEIHKEELHDKIITVNPHLTSDPEGNACTGAGLCYLCAKAVSEKNADLANLAIIGLIGDRHEANLSKVNQQIVNETKDLTIKKGINLYPATRPLRRTLEYATSPYIPGVTGNRPGVMELLRETNIPFDKSLLDLTEEEMSQLITAIMVRMAKSSAQDEIISNLYILKFFNTKEDVREISVLINACSRQGYHDIALAYCLENMGAKQKALEIYMGYKQELVSGLKTAEQMDKIQGDNFVIMNAKNQIKDTIIGTICSMISSSATYKEGTILIGMAYTQDKIKVSARAVGRNARNLKELMEKTVIDFKVEYPETTAEVGGHHFAAGCTVEKEKEVPFIETLKRNLEIEIVKL